MNEPDIVGIQVINDKVSILFPSPCCVDVSVLAVDLKLEVICRNIWADSQTLREGNIFQMELQITGDTSQ